MIPVSSFVFQCIILFCCFPIYNRETTLQPPRKKVYDIIFSFLRHKGIIPHFSNSAAKIQKFFDICKFICIFAIKISVCAFFLMLLFSSSPAHRSVDKSFATARDFCNWRWRTSFDGNSVTYCATRIPDLSSSA